MTIDALNLLGCTIDNEVVKEITMDGAVVWTSAPPIYRRRIMVGDNLKGKKVYLDFPDDFHTQIPEDEFNYDVIFVSGTDFIMTDSEFYYKEVIFDMTVDNFGANRYVYSYDTDAQFLMYNTKEVTMINDDYCTVISVDNTPTYRHIFIEDSNLRPIEVGDNLSGATLYFNFPDNLHNIYNNVNSTWTVAKCDGYVLAGITAFVHKDLPTFSIGMDKPSFKFYDYNKTNSTLTKNISSYVLPDDIGVVTKIYKNLPLIYDNILVDTKTMLRHIEVGDNLNGVTLYCNFPSGASFGDGSVAGTTNGEIWGWGMDDIIAANTHNYSFDVFLYSTANPTVNVASMTLPSDFGTVTSVTTSYPAYQYIWIREQQ